MAGKNLVYLELLRSGLGQGFESAVRCSNLVVYRDPFVKPEGSSEMRGFPRLAIWKHGIGMHARAASIAPASPGALPSCQNPATLVV